MVKIAVSLTVAIFYENPKNGQCSGHCGLKMASGERVKGTTNSINIDHDH